MITERNTKDKLKELSIKQDLCHKDEIHELRKVYVDKIYKLIKNYLVIIALFIFTQALASFYGKALSASIIVAVLTTTTANILGIFYIVTHWLYPAHK